MSDLNTHIKQLQNSLGQLIEANERRNPVDDWNYASEQLQELREMYDFRKLQVKGRAQKLISLLEVEE